MKKNAAGKKKGALFYALLGVCLGVWGYVFYRVARTPEPIEEPSAVVPSGGILEQAAPAASAQPGPRIDYTGEGRDPFARPPRLFTSRMAPSPGREPPAVREPPLVLSGVVDQAALLEGPSGSVFVARTGEYAGTVQVLSVRPDRVVVRFEGRSHTLRLVHNLR